MHKVDVLAKIFKGIFGNIPDATFQKFIQLNTFVKHLKGEQTKKYTSRS